ncbi:MAG: hypothetical protein IT440_16530, partial [Phycisphaeraceae bacterium]|nr:hypothetical protein [Phycisphaeraceae bacterium]
MNDPASSSTRTFRTGLLATAMLGAILAGCVGLRGVDDAGLSGRVRAQLARRQLTSRYADFVAFMADRLAASRGARRYSDKTGNCRLAWVEQLLLDPLASLDEAEQCTRQFHRAAGRDNGGVRDVVRLAGAKLDAGPAKAWDTPRRGALAGIDALGRTVAALHAEWQRTLAPLSTDEQAELRNSLYAQSTAETPSAHRFADAKQGRRVCDLLERLDRPAMLRAALAAAELTEPAFLATLATQPAPAAPPIAGISGDIAARQVTPAGLIIVGGTGPNRYSLDDLPDVCAVVDLGGDDTY